MLNKIVDTTLNGITAFYKMIDKNEVLSFTDIDEKSVRITFTNIRLYGLKIENPSNRIPQGDINFIFKKLLSQKKGTILLNIIKNDYEYMTYIYSDNEDLIDTIINVLGLEQNNKMNGLEIMLSFKDYFMYHNYRIEKNSLIDKNEEGLKEIIDNNLYHYFVEIASFNALKKNNVYQMTSKEYKNIDIYNFFSSNWKGVLSILLEGNLNQKKYLLEEKEKFAKNFDKDFFKILESIKKDGKAFNFLLEDTIAMNAIFIGQEKDANIITSQTGIYFVENNYNGDIFYKNTLLKKRDIGFTFFIPIEDIKKLFLTSRKKQSFIKYIDKAEWIAPDYWAYDYANGFINMCFKENTNPHALIVGETGSGKTTAIGKILKDAGFIDNNGKSELIDNDLFAIRYFDVDMSQSGLMKKIIENYKDKSLVITKDIKKFRFNVIDFDIIDKQISDLDKIFATSFLNMIYTILNKNTESFKASEIGILNEAIEAVYKNKDFVPNLSLSELYGENKGDYDEIIKELYAKGFNEYTKIQDLPDEYNFLKKPTLRSILNYLDLEKNDNTISRIRRENIENTIKKLEPLIQLGIFDYLPNRRFDKDYSILYIDITDIKGLPELIVSYIWQLINIFIKKDIQHANQREKEGKPKRKVYYILEESHNFLSIPIFVNLFNNLSKEIRKFNIELKFLIHRLSDISPDIYSSVATKIFLFKEGSKYIVKDQINQIDKLTPEREKIFELATNIPRGVFIIHSNGEDAVSFSLSKEELEIFKRKIF